MFLRGIFEQRATRHASIHPRDPALASLWATPNSVTGLSITPTLAMSATPVFAAIQLLAESVASLPIRVYRMEGGEKIREPTHPLWDLLRSDPNRSLTSYEWRELMEVHLDLRGNAYSEIVTDESGRIAELVPRMPDRVTPFVAPDGRPAYRYVPPGGGERVILADEMLHLRGLGFDGLRGLSPIEHARETIALSISAQQHGAAFFGNGAQAGTQIVHPGKLSPTAKADLRRAWEERHRGAGNQYRTAVLEEGMKIEPIGLSSRDAQFIEQQEFQVSDIARVFHRIPAHLLGDLRHATFSNIEHQATEYVRYTLRPILVRWEQSLRRALMTPRERARGLFVEFSVDGLLRGDTTARADYFAKMWSIGALSTNQIADLENLPRSAGGDERYVPLNMIPAAQAGLDRDSTSDSRAAAAPPENRASAPPAAQRSLADRQRLGAAFRPVFAAAAERVVRREIKALGAGARRLIGDGPRAAFVEWLQAYYDREWPAVVRDLRPPVDGYGRAIYAAAAEEVGGDAELDDAGAAFLIRYAESLATRHVASSRIQIEALVGPDAGEPADALAAVEGRLADWALTAAAALAAREVVQVDGAVAAVAYRRAGVRRVRWVTVGANCPLCESMRGRVAQIDDPFLPPGGTVAPEGVAPLVARRAVRHPPLHDGCNCQLVAEL